MMKLFEVATAVVLACYTMTPTKADENSTTNLNITDLNNENITSTKHLVTGNEENVTLAASNETATVNETTTTTASENKTSTANESTTTTARENKTLTANESTAVPANEMTIIANESITDTANENTTATANEVNNKNISLSSNLRAPDKNHCPVNNSNDYVDDLIERLKKNMSDSIPLPNKHGFITYTEGEVWGLTTMKRVSDSIVTCNGGIVILEAILRFEDLKGRYTWSRDSLFNTYSGFVYIKADTADILIRIINDGNSTTLDEFKITDVSGIETEVTGLSYITWSLSRITQPIVTLFRDLIIKIVEGPLREAIASEIQDMDLS